MSVSKLATIPSTIQLDIYAYLNIRDLIHLYKTSRYWRYRISNDEKLWRLIYKRRFGDEFAKDRWILWAVRRLWSQSSSEEKRLAACHVNLTMLERLDGYTWYCLVRGRILTEKNWRNNKPQRSIVFSKEQLNEDFSCKYTYARLTYGLVFVTRHSRQLNFAMVDDTLNVTPPTLVSRVQNNGDSPYPAVLASKIKDKSNVTRGRLVQSKPISDDIYIHPNVSSEEFIVANRVIIENDHDTYLLTDALLVWDIGHLEVYYKGSDQPYYMPRLCMTELLPWPMSRLLAQQSGWLIIQNWNDCMNEHEEYSQYMLYDIRRAHLAASFIISNSIKPILGKATPDKVQIYWGDVISIDDDDDTSNSQIFDLSEMGFYQHRWHIIEVSALPGAASHTADLSWRDRIPTRQVLSDVQEKYHNIKLHALKQGHWCDKNYRLKTIKSKKSIPLSDCTDPEVTTRHLYDDLFLILYKNERSDVLLVHSVRQQRALWSKTVLTHIKLIYEEKAILTYSKNSAKLLDMYTGKVLSSFKLQGCRRIRHIIGPICRVSGRETLLIDVRTGKKIRTLTPSQAAQSLLNSSEETNMKNTSIRNFLIPTRVEYVNPKGNAIWIDEYAQV
jgi:hypothetical protein